MDLARALTDPSFYDCTACERNPGRKVQLGHDGPPLQFWRENLITGEKLEECPMRAMLRIREAEPRLVRELERMRLEYFPLYRDGHLLVAGGVTEQPARYLGYMRELSAMERLVEGKINSLKAKNDSDPGET